MTLDVVFSEARKSVWLYHLTDASRLDSIRKDGLDPSCSREPYFRDRAVYFSGDPQHVGGYVNHHGDWKGVAVLLRVLSTDIPSEFLGPDDVDLPDILEQEGEDQNWFDVSWIDSLSISGQCTCTTVVPPDVISFSLYSREGECYDWQTLLETPIPKGC